MLVGASGSEINTEGIDIVAFFDPEDAQLSDDLEEGIVVGQIISFYYIGDHYSYTIRSKSEEDYVADDEDLWNQDDTVSLIIPQDKIKVSFLKS